MYYFVGFSKSEELIYQAVYPPRVGPETMVVILGKQQHSIALFYMPKPIPITSEK